MLDPRGALIWGTLRPTAAEAHKQFAKWNPEIDGFPYGEQVISIELAIKSQDNI